MEHLAGQRPRQEIEKDMLYYARGSKTDNIRPDEVRAILKEVFDKMGAKKRVLALPPDFTRLNSYAGPITEMV